MKLFAVIASAFLFTAANVQANDVSLDLNDYNQDQAAASAEELGAEGIDVSTLDATELRTESFNGSELAIPEMDARRRHGGRHGHDHRRHNRWKPGRPYFPGNGDGRWYPRPSPAPRHPMIASCFAQNARGIVFRARGWATRNELQRAAVRFCRQNSARPATCRPMGCRWN